MASIRELYALADQLPKLHTDTDHHSFSDGEEVIFIRGDLIGLTGKIVASDSRPGTASVFVPAFGGISYNIPAEHLHTLQS